MGHRNCELDMTHPLTTHTGQSDLYSTTVTDDALVLDPLIFSTGALPVTGRPEDSLAKKTTLLRLERPVVNRLRILHLTPAP